MVQLRVDKFVSKSVLPEEPVPCAAVQSSRSPTPSTLLRAYWRSEGGSSHLLPPLLHALLCHILTKHT